MSSKLASLHAGLIARKGEATPAVAHPAFSYVDAPRPAPQPVRHDGNGNGNGIERHSFATPGAPPAGDVPQLRAPEPVRAAPSAPERPVRAAPVRRHVAGNEPRPFRLTLRLTADQRRRLRIAAAKEEMSLQEVLSDALDSHLDTLCACDLRECSCLAREDSQHDAH